MRKLVGTFTLVLMALGLLVSSVGAAVTFDPATGAGFVGKGDVQTVLGLNNKQLQDNANSHVFTYESTTVTEVCWICTNTRNENTQEYERTTTTESSGVVSTVARERNQITGFNLLGFGESTSTSSTEGPQLNSCPNGWVLTPAADPEVISSSSSVLKINGVPLS